MNNLAFTHLPSRHRLQNLNGTLQFSHRDIKIERVSGVLDKNKFQLHGSLKNIIAYLLFDRQPLGLEMTLSTDAIDLNTILTNTSSKTTSRTNIFNIPSDLHVNFNYDIGMLRYGRFNPTDVKGNILIKNQVIALRRTSCSAFGGNLSFNGIIDGKDEKIVDFITFFKVENIFLDSVFYAFKDFNQSLLKSNHLRGRCDAEVDLEMRTDKKLNLFSKALIANIDLTIKNGVLDNFKPIQALKKYLPKDSLNHVRFAPIRNNILIENETIYIPAMRISTNVATIDISGTHTFDQKIDYRLVTPFRTRKKEDPNVTLDRSDRSKLFLRITGVSGNYKVAYDKERVKKKVIADIKKEINELREAFRRKEKHKKQAVELEEDSYFEWGDSTTVD